MGRLARVNLSAADNSRTGTVPRWTSARLRTRPGSSLGDQRRTEGRPLFVVNVADYVARAESAVSRAAVEQQIPENVRQMIELQVARRDGDDRS